MAAGIMESGSLAHQHLNADAFVCVPPVCGLFGTVGRGSPVAMTAQPATHIL